MKQKQAQDLIKQLDNPFASTETIRTIKTMIDYQNQKDPNARKVLLKIWEKQL